MMDTREFDALTRTFSTTGTRRGVLRLAAALPVAGTLAALLGDGAEAAAEKDPERGGSHRRRRRKARHRHRTGDAKQNRKGKRKGKGKQGRPAPSAACQPESRAQSCAGTCGQATNNCGASVTCGPCACASPCPICQVCDESTGRCVPDREAVDDACEACHTCNGDGQCAAVDDDTPCDDGDACTQIDTCQNGVCTGSHPVECPANECQIAATCNATDGSCPDPTNAANGTACSNGGVCCNGDCCDGCCGADGSCGACLVFVTSTTHQGNLGGLSGADAICQNLAQNAPTPLPGTYKAWLSDSTNSPSTRFRPSAQPYELVNGTPIADDWDDLTDESIDAKLNITERGGRVADSTFLDREWVWTHTKGDGTAGGAFNAHCLNWTTRSGTNDREDLNIGDGAAVGSTDSLWSSHPTAHPTAGSLCTGPGRLYCFQQE